MERRTVLARLDDILDAIVGVERMVADLDSVAFSQSFVHQRAIERCFEIISEASRHIPDQMKSEFPGVPWQQIKSIGNRLRHEYDRVDPVVVWQTATVSLPALRAVIESMIRRAERENL